MVNDFIGLTVTFIWVIIFLLSSEILARKSIIEKTTARKLIHISVGQVIFFLPLFENKLIAAGVPFIFTFGNLLLSPLSPIKKMRLKTFQAGHTFGTVLYPLALSVVTYLFFDKPFLVMICFFPVVFGDGLAAVVGPRMSSGYFTLWSGNKTIGGTITVFFASLLSITLGGYILSLYTPFILRLSYFGYISIISLVATIVELVSLKGMDNLFIPILSSILVIITNPIN